MVLGDLFDSPTRPATAKEIYETGVVQSASFVNASEMQSITKKPPGGTRRLG
jgi:hypothetical protein